MKPSTKTIVYIGIESQAHMDMKRKSTIIRAEQATDSLVDRLNPLVRIKKK